MNLPNFFIFRGKIGVVDFSRFVVHYTSCVNLLANRECFYLLLGFLDTYSGQRRSSSVKCVMLRSGSILTRFYWLLYVTWSKLTLQRARSIQPKFPEISVQNSMDRFGPTGKVSKKRVHLLRWSSFPGRTGWNFG